MATTKGRFSMRSSPYRQEGRGRSPQRSLFNPDFAHLLEGFLSRPHNGGHNEPVGAQHGLFHRLGGGQGAAPQGQAQDEELHPEEMGVHRGLAAAAVVVEPDPPGALLHLGRGLGAFHALHFQQQEVRSQGLFLQQGEALLAHPLPPAGGVYGVVVQQGGALPQDQGGVGRQTLFVVAAVHQVVALGVQILHAGQGPQFVGGEIRRHALLVNGGKLRRGHLFQFHGSQFLSKKVPVPREGDLSSYFTKKSFSGKARPGKLGKKRRGG